MLYIAIIILKMSDSSLSDVPIDLHSYDSYDTHEEPTLPPLPPLPTPIPPPNATPLRLQPPGPMLPVTTIYTIQEAIVFTFNTRQQSTNAQSNLSTTKLRILSYASTLGPDFNRQSLEALYPKASSNSIYSEKR